jgi:hypothetical protein
VPVKPKRDEIPVQEMEKLERDRQSQTGVAPAQMTQFSTSTGSDPGSAGSPSTPIPAAVQSILSGSSTSGQTAPIAKPNQ